MAWAAGILAVVAYALYVVARRRLTRTLDSRSVVLVTGCDTGFGLRIVKALLRETGACIIAGCVTKEGLQRLKSLDARVTAVHMDVTKDQDVEDAFREVGDRELAGVINNAGIGCYGWVEGLALDRYLKNIEINLAGTIRVTKRALPLLRQSRGRLITMGSMGGRSPSALGSAYLPTKAAVASFQDCVRMEVYRFGVYCSLIEPGFFATGMKHRSMESGKESSAAAGGDEDPAVVAAYGSLAQKLKGTEAAVTASEQINGGEEGVESVTHAVLDALLTRSPRTRYVVGVDANILGRVAFFIPDFAMDLIQTYLM